MNGSALFGGRTNPRGWLAALFVLLGLAGCAQTTPGQGQTPAPSYPSDRRGDMM
jgi:hypothetical protein